MVVRNWRRGMLIGKWFKRNGIGWKRREGNILSKDI